MTTAKPLDNTLKPIRDNGLKFQFATPLAMGAGHIDPNLALDLGLIYDATPQDYINLLYSMKLSKAQMLAIIGSNTYKCTNPSSDLNYPSFITFYDTKKMSSEVVQNFQGTVTNVGDVATYKAKIEAPKGSTVIVSPKTLTFKKKNEQ